MHYSWYSKSSTGWWTVESRVFDDTDEFDQYMDEAIDWLEENIEGSRKHCHWRIVAGPYCHHAQFRFRHERDFILFTLRWG